MQKVTLNLIRNARKTTFRYSSGFSNDNFSGNGGTRLCDHPSHWWQGHVEDDIPCYGLEDKVPQLGDGEAHFHIHNLDIEFDKDSLKHNILFPMLTNMMKNQIQRQIENEVELNLKKLVKTIGDQLTATMVQVNRPFMVGFDKVRGLMKESDIVHVNEQRKAKLE